VAIPASALQGLTDGQSYTLTANVSDVAGNAATANTSTSFAVDKTAPTLTLAAGAGGALVNAAEDTEGTVVAVTSDGSWTVTLTGQSGSVQKSGTGNGTIQLAAGDVTTLGQGAVLVSGVATDANGNST
jgi:hypothetical protein